MSDIDAIRALAHPGSVELDDWEVKDRQQRYLSDSGSSYFPAGFIQFQPSQGGVSELWVDWADPSTRLEIPISIAFPNYPVGTGPPGVCFKAGYVSLISNVTAVAQGQSIISEGVNATYLTAFQRLLMEHSQDWLASDAADSAFAPYTSTSTNPANNAGLAAMIALVLNDFVWLPSTSGSPTAYLNGVSSMPLNQVHPIFNEIKVAKLQIDQIRFFQQLNTSQNSPIFVAPSTLPSGYTTMPTVSIAGNVGSCRLRYQVITPTKQQMAAAERSHDATKKYFYRSVMMGTQQNPSSAVSQVKLLVAPSVTRPERLTLLRWPATVTAAPGGTSATYPATTCWDLYPVVADQTYALSQVQVFKGASPYFSDQLAVQNLFGQADDRDLYKEFRDLSGCTSIVPYESGSFVNLPMFRNVYNWIALNLSRDGHNGDTSAQNNTSLQLQVQFTVNNGALPAVPYVLTPLIDYTSCATFKSGRLVSLSVPEKKAT